SWSQTHLAKEETQHWSRFCYRECRIRTRYPVHMCCSHTVVDRSPGQVIPRWRCRCKHLLDSVAVVAVLQNAPRTSSFCSAGSTEDSGINIQPCQSSPCIGQH